MGCLINDTNEFVLGSVCLPPDAVQLVWVTVCGTSAVLEADSMMFGIEMNAGGDNDAYNRDAFGALTKASTSSNFAANDNIFWVFTHNDDADMRDFTGGDCIEIKLKYSAAVDVDCATNVYIKSIKLWFV